MVLAYHFIFSAYGFWLPNDPRGSWSETIRQFDLLAYGPVTKVDTDRNLAHDAHDLAQRLRAKEALLHDPVKFTGLQARAIFRGFLLAAQEGAYDLHALAILPDHSHVILGRHDVHIDRIASHMKAKATAQLNREGLHPFVDQPRKDGTLPSLWARKHWCPFIDSDAYLQRAIEYVRLNPLKCGLPEQRWRGIPPVR